MALSVCGAMLPALPSSLNSAPCPCASLLSQRARCGWIRDRALPTHPAGEALPRVPRPREREREREGEGKRERKREGEGKKGGCERGIWSDWKWLKEDEQRHAKQKSGVHTRGGKKSDLFLSFLLLVVCFFLCCRSRAVAKPQVHNEVQALCLRSALIPVLFWASRGHCSSTDWAERADRWRWKLLRDRQLRFICSWVTTLLSQAFLNVCKNLHLFFLKKSTLLLSFIFHSVKLFDNRCTHLIADDLCRRPRVIQSCCTVHRA